MLEIGAGIVEIVLKTDSEAVLTYYSPLLTIALDSSLNVTRLMLAGNLLTDDTVLGLSAPLLNLVVAGSIPPRGPGAAP